MIPGVLFTLDLTRIVNRQEDEVKKPGTRQIFYCDIDIHVRRIKEYTKIPHTCCLFLREPRSSF